MNEYAILLKKVSSDTLRNFYIYEAEKIIKGHLNEEKNIFVSDNGEKIYCFGNKKILNKTNKKFVSLVLNEDELLDRYDEAKNINEALSLFYMDATKVMNIVSYDYNTNEIKMCSIDKIGVIDNLNGTLKEKQEKSELEIQFEEITKQLEDNFTLLTETEYRELMELDLIDEFITNLSIIQFTKEGYLEKFENAANDSYWSVFIDDDLLMPVYHQETLEEAKKYLTSISIRTEEQKRFDSMEYLCHKFKKIKDDLLLLEDLDLIKKLLNLVLNDFKKLRKQFVIMIDSGMDVSEVVELIDIYIKEIEKILKLDNIDEIKTRYENLYIQTEENIISVGMNLNKKLNTAREEKINFEDVMESLNNEEIIKLYELSIESIRKLNSLEQIRIYTLEMRKNFNLIKEKMLNCTDIDIERESVNNLCDNILYCYEEIYNLKDIDKKEELLKEIHEYIYDDIKEFALLFDKIINRIEESMSIKEKKKIIMDNLIKKIEKPYNELQALVGLEDIKKHVDFLLKERVYNLLFDDRKIKRDRRYNYFFTGNPGTGKTTVAEILCEILAKLGMIKNNKIKKTTASDFIAGYIGQTAIKTKELIEESKGGIIFIDEAYALAQDYKNSFSKDVFGELLPAMSSGEVSIIFAGYNDEMKSFLDSNTGIKDRINNYFEFRDYTIDELTNMFISIANHYEYQVSDEAKELFKQIIIEEKEKKNFGNGRVVKNFTDKILDAHEINMIDYDIEDNTTITVLDIENAKLKDTVYKEKVKKIGF